MKRNSWTSSSIGFVCEYQKKSVWFSTYNIRYAVITNDTLRIFKNEKEFKLFVKEQKTGNKKINSSTNPKESIYLRRIHLSQVKNEARHPYLLMIKDRGNVHLLSFTNSEDMNQCIIAINSAQRSSIVRSNSIGNEFAMPSGNGFNDDTNVTIMFGNNKGVDTSNTVNSNNNNNNNSNSNSNKQYPNLPKYDASVMSENELNRYYDELLMSFNIPLSKRKEMINEKTANSKWIFVISNLLKQQGLSPELWTPTSPDDIYTIIATAPNIIASIDNNSINNNNSLTKSKNKFKNKISRQKRTQTAAVVSPRIVERHNINREVSYWIRVLRIPENIQLEQLTDVSERLYEENVDWLTGFVNEQGLTLLIQYIPYTMNIQDLGMQFALQTELLRCLKAIMDKQAGNMKLGLQYIVEDNNAIQGITDLFDNQSLQVRLLVVKLLTAVCWSSNEGFEKVIDALETYRKNNMLETIWIPIVSSLRPMILAYNNLSSNNENEYSSISDGSDDYDIDNDNNDTVDEDSADTTTDDDYSSTSDNDDGKDDKKDDSSVKTKSSKKSSDAITRSFTTTTFDDKKNNRNNLSPNDTSSNATTPSNASNNSTMTVPLQKAKSVNGKNENRKKRGKSKNNKSKFSKSAIEKRSKMIGKQRQAKSEVEIDSNVNVPPFEFTVYTIGLINALLNSFPTLEDRVEYRKDLDRLGFEKIILYLENLITSVKDQMLNDQFDSSPMLDDNGRLNTRRRIQDHSNVMDMIQGNDNGFYGMNPLIAKMEEQIELYQSVKIQDLRQVTLNGIDLSNPRHLFEFLDSNSINDGYVAEFTHILQSLTAIPKNAPFLWSTIEKIVGKATTPVRKRQLQPSNESKSDDNLLRNNNHNNNNNSSNNNDSLENATFPSLMELKTLLSRYDNDVAMLDFESEKHKQDVALLEQQIINLKAQLRNQAKIMDAMSAKQSAMKLQLKKHNRNSSTFMNIKSILFDSFENSMHSSSDDDDDNSSSLQFLHARKSANSTKNSPLNVIDDEKASAVNGDSPFNALTNVGRRKAPSQKAPKAPRDSDSNDSNSISIGNTMDHQSIAQKLQAELLKNKEKQQGSSNDTTVATTTSANGDNGNNGNNGNNGSDEPPENLKKYLKMKKLGIPMASIETEMRKDKIDSQLLHDYLEHAKSGQSSSNNNGSAASTASTASAASEPPAILGKYLKMKKLGVPIPSIETQMRKDKVDVQLLHDYLNGGGASGGGSSNSNTGTKEAPPELAKYLKMKKLGVPLPAIETQMRKDKVDVSILHNYLGTSGSGGGGGSGSGAASGSAGRSLADLMKNRSKNGGNKDGTSRNRIDSYEFVPEGMKKKAEIKPKTKMRQLHWSKVKPKDVKGTVWDNVNENDIKVDFSSFEEMFAQPTSKSTWKPGGNKGDSSSGGSSKLKKNEEVHLVDAKRSYNVDIGLSRFKMSHIAIRDAILTMNEEVLTLDKITKLLNFVPDETESDLVKSYEGDVRNLANTEKFFYTLSSIDDLPERMKLWQFKLQFNELMENARENIDLLRKGHDNVKNSKGFETLLKYILALGNYMNGGTKKGKAYGFSLSSLKQLLASKSKDNKITLMEYLINIINKQDPKIFEFLNDFEILDSCSRLDVTFLSQNVNIIGMNLRKIKAQLNKIENEKKIDRNKDYFHKMMKIFYDSNFKSFEKLKKEFEETKKDCKSLAEYFHCKKDEKFEYFTTLNQFRLNFIETQKLIERKEKQIEKKRKMEQFKLQRMQTMKAKKMKKSMANDINSNIDRSNGMSPSYKRKLENNSHMNFKDQDRPGSTKFKRYQTLPGNILAHSEQAPKKEEAIANPELTAILQTRRQKSHNEHGNNNNNNIGASSGIMITKKIADKLAPLTDDIINEINIENADYRRESVAVNMNNFGNDPRNRVMSIKQRYNNANDRMSFVKTFQSRTSMSSQYGAMLSKYEHSNHDNHSSHTNHTSHSNHYYGAAAGSNNNSRKPSTIHKTNLNSNLSKESTKSNRKQKNHRKKKHSSSNSSKNKSKEKKPNKDRKKLSSWFNFG